MPKQEFFRIKFSNKVKKMKKYNIQELNGSCFINMSSGKGELKNVFFLG